MNSQIQRFSAPDRANCGRPVGRSSIAQDHWAARSSFRVLILVFCLGARAYSQSPVVNSQGLVNAATGKSASSVPVAARGSLVSIFGSHLATIVATSHGLPIPTILSGTETRVWFD